jgi:uncharacterized protein (TIGR03067 family)
MKTFARILLLIGLPAITGCTSDDLRSDEDRIQSSWIMMSGVIDGKEQYVGSALFNGDKLDLRVKKQDLYKTFRLDATTNPKGINFINRAGTPTYGIYSLDKETLKICLAAPGGERPKEFAAKSKSGQALFVFKRDKMEISTAKEQYREKNKDAKLAQ